jgi:hypothetical protein
MMTLVGNIEDELESVMTSFVLSTYNKAHLAHHCLLSNTSKKAQKLKHKLEMKTSMN